MKLIALAKVPVKEDSKYLCPFNNYCKRTFLDACLVLVLRF